MFPDVNINIEETHAASKERLGKVYAYNYVQDRYVLVDGKLVEADNVQAVKQWLHLLLRTQTDKYKIYKNTFFGLPIEELVGNKGLPLIIAKAQLEEEIKEKAKEHVLISNITNFKVQTEGTKMTISFYVELKDGAVEEVTIDVNR